MPDLGEQPDSARVHLAPARGVLPQPGHLSRPQVNGYLSFGGFSTGNFAIFPERQFLAHFTATIFSVLLLLTHL